MRRPISRFPVHQLSARKFYLRTSSATFRTVSLSYFRPLAANKLKISGRTQSRFRRPLTSENSKAPPELAIEDPQSSNCGISSDFGDRCSANFPWTTVSSTEIPSSKTSARDETSLFDRYALLSSTGRICSPHRGTWDPDFDRIFDGFMQNGGVEFFMSAGNSPLKKIIHDIHSCQQGLSIQLETVSLAPEIRFSPMSHKGPILSHNSQAPFWSQPASFWTNFQTFKFLDDAAFCKLRQIDYDYLLQSGCFEVPSRSTLSNFVTEYFLHIHPMLPILDEKSFWSVYSGVSDSSTKLQRISLFVFQAMLAAGSLVSKLTHSSTTSCCCSKLAQAPNLLL